jgi:hypothetical protein
MRVHRVAGDTAARYEEVVVVRPWGPGTPLHRERLAHGASQLVVLGAGSQEFERAPEMQVRIATLGLEPVPVAPQRLTASIVLAEVSRQVGRAGRVPGIAVDVPRYRKSLEPARRRGDIALIDPSELLEF